MGVFPGWMTKLMQRVNKDGDKGVPDIVDHLPLFQRAGVLMDRPEFAGAFEQLVKGQERIAALLDGPLAPMPQDFTSQDFPERIQAWMQRALTMCFGFPIDVPSFPRWLNRKQMRLFKKYHFNFFYVPLLLENQFPDSWTRLDWFRLERRILVECGNEATTLLRRQSLPGKWVAFESMSRSVSDLGGHINELTQAIGETSRFGVPFGAPIECKTVHPDHKMIYGEAGGTGLLDAMHAALGTPSGARAGVPTAEVWNFIGNFSRWCTQQVGEPTLSLEWTSPSEFVSNAFGAHHVLVISSLSSLTYRTRHLSHAGVTFRCCIEF